MFPLMAASRRNGGGASAWSAASALITSTKSWSLDPTNAARLWDDSTRTTPIGSPPAFIAAIDNDTNTAAYMGQGTGTSEPGWNGLSLEYDALDDSVNADATFPSTIRSWLNAIDGWTVCMKLNVSALASTRQLLVTTSNIAGIDITSGGALRVISRRLAADANYQIASSAGAITISTNRIVTVTCNYQTGLVAARVDGVEVLSGTATWATGATAASDITAIRIGRSLSNTNPMGGRIGRVIALAYVATAEQIATLEAGVNEAALS